MKTLLCKQKFASVMQLVILCAAVAQAQITMVRPQDVNGWLKAGTAHVKMVPAFTGDTLKPFDGNQFNALEMVGTDTLTITLQFDSSAQIEKSKIFFWHGAQWSLETASNQNDLDTKTGSYKKPVSAHAANFFQWDSVVFAAQSVRFVRLAVKNPSDSSIRLGEWTLEGTVTFVKYLLVPQPIRLIPSASVKLGYKIVDDQGNIYPFSLLVQPLIWKSDNNAVATVDEDGVVKGIAIGSTAVTLTNSEKTLNGSAPVLVVQDFRSEKVKPMTIKVVLVNQNPRLQSGNKLNQEFGWRDPNVLADKLVVHFREATDSVINFQIVERIEAAELFTRYYGNFLSIPTYVQLLKEPGWPTLKKASDSGQIYFDYRECVKYYHFDERRNSGEIDEVWVFSAPYLGMYESQLMGPNAFWWNSPPIKDGTALTKLLSVMGLNYERGVDQAFHSFGHRSESAIRNIYSEVQGKPWAPTSANPTPWDLFTRIDKDMPERAHVGNIHYPPNGDRDYDYGNTKYVRSYAENWYRYPYLFDQNSAVSVQTWYYSQVDPLAEGNDHLGYLRWWYGHLPRYTGSTDGILNNWWHYILDYEGAKELAKITPPVGVFEKNSPALPHAHALEQNYPNPFNPSTTINFTLHVSTHVTLKIFDMLGREVTTLLDEPMNGGLHAHYWDASTYPSGVYFYQLKTNENVQVRKMILVK
jgi:hypothetical protein